jgi:hypothetical protein
LAQKKFWNLFGISPKEKAEARADSSPDPFSARASPSPRLLCPRKIVAGRIIHFFRKKFEQMLK